MTTVLVTEAAVTEAVDGRELIALDGSDGVVLRGTYHRDPRSAERIQDGPDRIGLLFLSGLNQTRAANGDAAIFWAESLAEQGYPSIRLDLPGFGDSAGDPPAETLAFINAGGYAPVASAAIGELVDQFRLSGVILVGHCTGTVSAIYTAAANPHCKGLVLMDPIFFLPQTKVKILKIRRQVHEWVLRFGLDAVLTAMYDLAKEIRLLVRGNAPPENANLPLLRRWKDVASTGLPVLILRSPRRKPLGTKVRTGEFDYLRHIVTLAGRKSRIVVDVAEGANHSFANLQGRAAVLRQVSAWLDTNFPLASRCNANAPAPQREAGVAVGLAERPATC